MNAFIDCLTYLDNTHFLQFGAAFPLIIFSYNGNFKISFSMTGMQQTSARHNPPFCTQFCEAGLRPCNHLGFAIWVHWSLLTGGKTAQRAGKMDPAPPCLFAVPASIAPAVVPHHLKLSLLQTFESQDPINDLSCLSQLEISSCFFFSIFTCYQKHTKWYKYY